MPNTTLKAPAKLNLYLDILSKRPDGYHEVLNVMCLIDLADEVTLTVTDGQGIELTCTNAQIPTDERNTAHKAAKLFLERVNCADKQVDLAIVKQIPVMAGLGGSSADAAAVLRGLNELFGDPLTLAELMSIGALIGSDVPFCIHGGCAVCTGRGEIVAKVLDTPPCTFVVIKPAVSVSTEDAYALYAANPPSPNGAFQSGGFPFYNVFEKLLNFPETAEIKQNLLDHGAISALLTGSGSAVYGVFDSLEKAEKAYESLNYSEKFIAKPY
ncbi:MAG: 4-(cytidine 5'-diphospho)-2-C-methyl-D-erythritol kinase [Oscillospiraceae bacterium]|nr:4-(cytidine 5'-diphospho)-2-C-methyl-D-erythritol kinase [Oscillospiraceae bacterium]